MKYLTYMIMATVIISCEPAEVEPIVVPVKYELIDYYETHHGLIRWKNPIYICDAYKFRLFFYPGNKDWIFQSVCPDDHVNAQFLGVDSTFEFAQSMRIAELKTFPGVPYCVKFMNDTQVAVRADSAYKAQFFFYEIIN